MNKNLFRKVLFYISVPKCVACKAKLDVDDDGLCKSCIEEYAEVKGRNCSRCSKLLCECSCSNEFLENHYVKRLIKIYRYVLHHDQTPSNNLIYSLKRDNRNDVLTFLSSELEAAVRHSIKDPEKYIITNVPRRRAAIKKYGIDHAKILAKALAKRLGCQYVSCLISKSKLPQKSTFAKERISNAEFDLKNVDIKGKRVIIVDDIVTTGASLGSCAALLHAVGAKEIVGCAIAVAYKDKYKPFLYTPDIK